ncbi:MBL fold metallo-hydrolase [Caldithrix abyssi]
MSIYHRLLGQPYQDNALFVKINTGQSIYRLLFDCGENTISNLPQTEIMRIDHLFFSHFHLDHVADLDRFIRLNYNRPEKPVHIWGPPGTLGKIFNRLNSFTWNLLSDAGARWFIHEAGKNSLKHFLLLAKDQFKKAYLQKEEPVADAILSLPAFKVFAATLDHKIPVLGFKATETPRKKINVAQLEQLSLPAGPWIKTLKNDAVADEKELEINGRRYNVGFLRKKLLTIIPGNSLCYLTDFIFPQNDGGRLIQWLKNCDVVYCESQYLTEDLPLAEKNFHLTVQQAARLASQANVGQLFIFHFSQRYKDLSPLTFLNQARKTFRRSFLPDSWEKI